MNLRPQRPKRRALPTAPLPAERVKGISLLGNPRFSDVRFTHCLPLRENICFPGPFRGSIPSRYNKILLERVKGIEPSYQVWKTRALPLSYTRLIMHYLIVILLNYHKVNSLMEGLVGIEPTTSCLRGNRSTPELQALFALLKVNLVNTKHIVRWRPLKDSNPRPPRPKRGALIR